MQLVVGDNGKPKTISCRRIKAYDVVLRAIAISSLHLLRVNVVNCCRVLVKGKGSACLLIPSLGQNRIYMDLTVTLTLKWAFTRGDLRTFTI